VTRWRREEPDSELEGDLSRPSGGLRALSEVAAHVVVPEGFEPDDGLPHAGMWSRPNGEDMMRCREHGLCPDEH
jgi:hypothetical protein